MNTKVIRKGMQKRKVKTRVRKAIVGTLIYISLMLISVAAFANWLQGDIPVKYDGEFTTYVVSKGDRLWNIAEQYADGNDIREVIYIIEKDNNLDSADLSIGQELKIRNEF